MKSIVCFFIVTFSLVSTVQDVFAGGFFGNVKGKIESTLGKKQLNLPSEEDYAKLAIKGDNLPNKENLKSYLNDISLRLRILTDQHAPQLREGLRKVYDSGKDLISSFTKIKSTILEEAENELKDIIRKLDGAWEKLALQQTKNDQQKKILNSIEQFKNQLKKSAANLISFVRTKRAADKIHLKITNINALTKIDPYSSQITQANKELSALIKQYAPQRKDLWEKIKKASDKINEIFSNTVRLGQASSQKSNDFISLKAIYDDLVNYQNQLNSSSILDNKLLEYINVIKTNIDQIVRTYFPRP